MLLSYFLYLIEEKQLNIRRLRNDRILRFIAFLAKNLVISCKLRLILEKKKKKIKNGVKVVGDILL
jgi:hypothetical protein